jgi:hypothetical protein
MWGVLAGIALTSMNGAFLPCGGIAALQRAAETSEPDGSDSRADALSTPSDTELLADDNPAKLRLPPNPTQPQPELTVAPEAELLLRIAMDPPLGFTGPTGVAPTEDQESSHFVPVEDRWRLGFPAWDRYGKGHPWVDDYPYVLGRWWDPFNQNVLKGDYPIIGQHTFLNLTASSLSLFEYRQVPTGTTPFESTRQPFQEEFFGKPDQFFYSQYLRLSIDLFHGDAGFKPIDWRVRITPVFNINYLDVDELAVVNPDVRKGTTRGRTFLALEEWFLESKIADLSPDYDFVSVRAGSQYFNSDFRGFVFSDTNRAVRLFGTRLSNREQFNIIWFDQMGKDTNSELNNIEQDRHQNTVILNYYRQDAIWPGYTAQVSLHYNNDKPSFRFDKNRFLVRPDPVGTFQPHEIEVVYIGWAGEGHIGRYNISHAAYWVLGHDSQNPLSNSRQDVNAQMAALELSYDRDWARFRSSFFFASGDDDIQDDDAEGFDAIFDNPNFAGGEFSYWQRQAVRLFGVNLVNRGSLVPNLRSSKIQGQTNFVNPGLLLFNVGVDFDITPKLKMINNANFLWFDSTKVLEQFVFDGRIARHIGADLSMGFEYRPFLNNNMIMVFGISSLIPGAGFRDLYDELHGAVDPLVAGFLEVNLTY